MTRCDHGRFWLDVINVSEDDRWNEVPSVAARLLERCFAAPDARKPVHPGVSDASAPIQ